MFWCFFLMLTVQSRPVQRSQEDNETVNVITIADDNSTLPNNTTLIVDIALSEQKEKVFNLSSILTLRKNDWRDAHEGKMIIWSLESHNHPDYGKAIAKGIKDTHRNTSSSQLMSFMILGSVIGFILYTYLSHVLMQRRLDREEKAAELRELVKRSALLMAGSGTSTDLVQTAERKRSLINMFRGFKL